MQQGESSSLINGRTRRTSSDIVSISHAPTAVLELTDVLRRESRAAIQAGIQDDILLLLEQSDIVQRTLLDPRRFPWVRRHAIVLPGVIFQALRRDKRRLRHVRGFFDLDVAETSENEDDAGENCTIVHGEDRRSELLEVCDSSCEVEMPVRRIRDRSAP